MPIAIEDTSPKPAKLVSVGSQVGGGYAPLLFPHQGCQAGVYALGKSAENIVISGIGETIKGVTWVGSLGSSIEGATQRECVFTCHGISNYTERSGCASVPAALDSILCTTFTVNQSLTTPGTGVSYYSTFEEQPKSSLPIAAPPFAAEYEKLGRVRGRDGTPDARERSCAFWRQRGLDGAKWLINRLEHEASVETLDAAAAILRQMDKSVLGLIADTLDENPSPEVVEALIRGLSARRPQLTALCWTALRGISLSIPETASRF